MIAANSYISHKPDFHIKCYNAYIIPHKSSKWVYMCVKIQYAKNKVTLFDIPITGFKKTSGLAIIKSAPKYHLIPFSCS